MADIFTVAGKDQSNSLNCGIFFFTFLGDLQITRHLWRLTQIPGDLAGLLTHSKNVTTSIHLREKTSTKSLGGHGPRAPPPWLRHWMLLKFNYSYTVLGCNFHLISCLDTRPTRTTPLCLAKSPHNVTLMMNVYRNQGQYSACCLTG